LKALVNRVESVGIDDSVPSDPFNRASYLFRKRSHHRWSGDTEAEVALPARSGFRGAPLIFPEADIRFGTAAAA
jgi:hypothetical protein